LSLRNLGEIEIGKKGQRFGGFDFEIRVYFRMNWWRNWIVVLSVVNWEVYADGSD